MMDNNYNTMKKLLLLFAIAMFAIPMYSQAGDTIKITQYQCLTISNIMENKIAEVWLDDGIKKRSIGVRKDDGTLFSSNIEVLNYVCAKYNLELITVTEAKNVYRFYLRKK